MKFLILLLVILFGVWLWKRSQTLKSRPPKAPSPPKDTGPQTMVACLHCQTHLPNEDAVRGVLGVYCSIAHREAAGDKSPPV
jgi:uncharacterized protein